MYYRTFGWIESLIVIVSGMVILSVLLSMLWQKLFHKDFFSGGFYSSAVKSLVILFVGGGLVGFCLGEAYRPFNPEHRAFYEQTHYFDPYGQHYWPLNNEFYDADGNRITYEEGIAAYNDSHDFALDKEGNILGIYKKGECPEELIDHTRDMDCPYYIFNMSEDEENAYYLAVSLIEGKSISRKELYQALVEDYSYDVANFAIEAVEQNEKVNWIEECRQAADIIMTWNPTRDEAMESLTGEDGRGFSVEEANIALNEYFN